MTQCDNLTPITGRELSRIGLRHILLYTVYVDPTMQESANCGKCDVNATIPQIRVFSTSDPLTSPWTEA